MVFRLLINQTQCLVPNNSLTIGIVVDSMKQITTVKRRSALMMWNIVLFILLQPANEVWGKVMFSEACVSHSVHRWNLCIMSLPVWLPLLESSLSLVPFTSVGVSLGILCPGGFCRDPPESEKAGSMHSTGMLSSYRLQTKFAKVMFLHLSVSYSVHRGMSRPRGVCLRRYVQVQARRGSPGPGPGPDPEGPDPGLVGVSQHAVRQTPSAPSTDGYCCGRYAFLLGCILVTNFFSWK